MFALLLFFACPFRVSSVYPVHKEKLRKSGGSLCSAQSRKLVVVFVSDCALLFFSGIPNRIKTKTELGPRSVVAGARRSVILEPGVVARHLSRHTPGWIVDKHLLEKIEAGLVEVVTKGLIVVARPLGE